ncbi:MAG: hypothetical protein HYX61_05785 [Gammaproteobacteria bacterium]|jgi:opacity protein-like surface antigen|nr:hypothetical protein [Gammaproteobacteria bacterium]
MKKIGALFCLLGSLFGLGSLSAYEPPPKHEKWQDHWPESVWKKEWDKSFLVGVLGGYADREANLLATVSYGGIPIVPQSIIVRDVSDTGLIYGVLAGYQGKCQKWILGLELNVENHEFEEDHPFAFSDPAGLFGITGNTRYERDWMAGLTVRAGYYIVDYVMPYVRLGAETGRDRLQTTFSANFDGETGSILLQDERWIWRFLSGVGIEFPIYCTALTMRMEYQFHSKGKTLDTDNIFTDGDVMPIFNSNMQPKTQTGIIAIVRNFD